MKFDRFFNSKFFTVLETVYRIIILNMLTILCTVLGLVIFGLIPSLITLAICIKSLNSDTDFPLIKSYFVIFKANFKKSLLYSLFFILFILLCLLNTYYLYCAVNEWGTFTWIILYTFMLVIDCIAVLAIINLGFVYSYFPNLSYWKTIKYSFVLLFAEMWKELVTFALILGSIYLVALFPYVFIFVVIGVIYYVYNLLIKNDYLRITPKEITGLTVFSYINGKNIEKSDIKEENK